MTSKIFHHILTLVILLSQITKSHAQNLMVDGDFEIITECPIGPKGSCTGNQTLSYLEYWHPINSWEADYFNTCQRLPSNKDNNVNMLKIPEPQSRNGFIGILATTFKGRARDENNATYAMSELKMPLISGKKYHIEFYAMLSEKSTVAIANLGVYFSIETPLSVSGLFSRYQVNGINVKPQFEHRTVINDIGNWTKIEGDIIAEGGEKFIVIGCFSDNNVLNWMYTDPEKKTWTHQNKALSYYFIDNMSIYKLEKSKAINSVSPLILENVLFDIDSYEIQSSFYRDLNALYFHMNEEDISIGISGHSDKTGLTKNNNELSLNRAKSIKQYLVKKGISEDRILIKGYGSSIPAKDNLTVEGRDANRRIEIKIL